MLIFLSLVSPNPIAAAPTFLNEILTVSFFPFPAAFSFAVDSSLAKLALRHFSINLGLYIAWGDKEEL